MQENKRVELGEKLRQAKQSVTSYTSSIENMKAQRDTTLSDIERFQLGLDVCFPTYFFTAYAYMYFYIVG